MLVIRNRKKEPLMSGSQAEVEVCILGVSLLNLMGDFVCYFAGWEVLGCNGWERWHCNMEILILLTIGVNCFRGSSSLRSSKKLA